MPTQVHGRKTEDAAGHSLLGEMVRLAAPTVATMTSYTAMQFVDGLMVSRITPADPVYIAAQGNGGMAAWVPIAVVLGFLTIVNTFVSQHFGAGRPERGAAFAWNSLWLAAVSALLLLPYAAALPALFDWMDHGPRLRELELEYARILLWGAVLTMATRGIAQFFYGLHRPMTVLGAALVGNATNVAMNWVFIFGKLGAPEMGVTGAAVGTIIGTAVELAIPMAVFLGPAMNLRFHTRRAWRPDGPVMRQILRVGWPGAMTFGNEMLCWGYFCVYLAGKFGAVHQTAGWIALRYMHLSFMPAVGISIAVQAMVGKCMGMKRPDLAVRRAWTGLALNLAYMGACAVGFVLLREPMVRLFIKEGMSPGDVAELVRIGSHILILAAVFQLFDATAITMSAALRGAGDTVWQGVMAVILAWTCLVGGGHLFVAFAPELKSIGPWIGASAYIILYGVLVLGRFVRGRWKRIDLVTSPAPSVEPGGVAAAAAPADPGDARG